ncbi:MAG: nitroreductase family protein [Promethearchaeia archaeon]
MRNDEPTGFYRILKQRRSVRKLSGEVTQEQVEKLVHAASMAPSAHNSQPWHFFCIEDQEKKESMLEQMSSAWKEDLMNDGFTEDQACETVEKSQDKIRAAPCLILVCLTMVEMESYPDASRQSAEYVMAVQSTAASIQNLLLAAEAEGLGACWLCAPLFSKQRVKRSLNLPDHFEPQAFIILGEPDAEPKAPCRKDIDEVLHFV